MLGFWARYGLTHLRKAPPLRWPEEFVDELPRNPPPRNSSETNSRCMKTFLRWSLLVFMTLTLGACAGSRPAEMADTPQTGKFEVAPSGLDPQIYDDESGDLRFNRQTDDYTAPVAKPSLALPE